MNTDIQMIPLQNNNILTIKKEEIVIIYTVEGGGMGSPGEIIFVLKNGVVYQGNYIYGDLDVEHTSSLFPFLEKKLGKLDDNWKMIDLGMKNYLIIRVDYFEGYKQELLKCIDGHFLPQKVILSNWLSLAIKYFGSK